MDIQIVTIKQLKYSPFNPRTIKDSTFNRLKSCIKEHGLLQPLIINQLTDHVVGGNQRLKALIELGYSEVEVVFVNLSLEREKLLNLRLNKISGEWDMEALSHLLEELSTIPDINIEDSGFELPEISEIFDRFSEPKDGDNFDFETDSNSIKESITKRGDLVELGLHRTLCGDAANPDDVKKLFGSEKADAVHMDPPYGCSYLAQNRPDLESRPKKSKRWQKLYKDDLNEKEYESWIEVVLKNLSNFLKPGASAYVWNGHAKFYFMHQVLKNTGFHISTVITWAKPTFAISYGDFNQQTEFCLYGWLKNGSHKWYGPTNETNLWEIDRDKVANLIHPTQKSVQIPSRAIRNSSKRGDIIADLFLGSGSTLIAAESLGRRCFGMEIEPRYVDAIVRRYIDFVGLDKVPSQLKNKYLVKEAK